MAAVCFAALLAQSGSTSDMELSFEWIWQKMPHGEAAASAPLSRGSPSRGYRAGGERSEPLRGPCAGMSVQRGSSSSAASGAGCPAGQARWGEARSLLRNAAWPQAPAVFSKEVLALFLLGSSKPVLFCCWGWWWGMRENCLVGVFKNTLEDNRE